MTERKEVKVTVKDKRASSAEATATSDPQKMSNDPSDRSTFSEGPAAAAASAIEADYLSDLQRLQAEFENYRKRMMKEQADSSVRAKARLVESLLPVLDNFERAISHGEGVEGVALVYREFKTALENEGLEEVPAEGEPFDPNLHEAVQSREDPSVAEETVVEVHRRGYRFGDQLLRPATVVVARPVESAEPAEEVAEG